MDRRSYTSLGFVLLIGLILRVLLWNQLPRTGLISDEGEYLAAATWLAEGRNFSWYQGYLWTRAPLYPLFVAAHLRAFGQSLTPIFITQTALSLVNVALVYLLARRVSGIGYQVSADPSAAPGTRHLIPSLAALMMAIYFPFAIYTQVLLSETLYITLLLAAFVALSNRRPTADDRPATARVIRHWPLFLGGALLGLATLTRSLTLPFPPLVALWLLLARPTTDDRRRIVFGGRWSAAIVFSLAAAIIILPWTVYNSRMYGGLVLVDTSGAYNLLLGGRTAYDGTRQDAWVRDFALELLGQRPSVSRAAEACARPFPGALPSQAARQGAMTREGLCLIAAKPLAFVQKSLAELLDFFQINYSGDERFTDEFTLGRLSPWYAAGLFLLDDTLYVFTLPLAVVGWALARQEGGIQNGDTTSFLVSNSTLLTLVGMWWLYTVAVAPLLFAINRFRLPLLPFAFIFAAYALVALGRGGWRRAGWGYRALAALLLLAAATPYAYVEPRAPGEPSKWASYLGPYPSSLASTALAWRKRPEYLAEQQLKAALGNGDAAEARRLLNRPDIAERARRIALPLLAGLEAAPEAGLRLLDANPPQSAVEDAVVRGELLRRAGDLAGAKSTLGQTFVDNENPIQFAWDWLHPPPLPGNRLDLAGDLDLGYVEGCYLGEGDPGANGTFRWCTDGARLRFPGAGSGAPQTLALRVDGRGWSSFASAAPPVRVQINGVEAGVFTPDLAAPREVTVALPATAPGADVIVTLRTDTFVSEPARYLSQQGRAVVGQVQRLGARLDWAELREIAQ